MVVIYGSRLMGKTDFVPGLFHVATRFGHIYYLPLIPMASYVVLGQSGENFRGVPITLSAKSILLAWARAGLFVVGVIVSIVAAVSFGDKNMGNPITQCLIAAAIWILFAMSWHKSINRASFNRACAIGNKIGLNAQGMEIIRKVYGEAAMRGFDVKAATAPPTTQQRAVPPPPMARPVRATPVDDGGAIPLEPQMPAPRAKPQSEGQIGLT
jgi:hypothetical protein